MLMDWFKDHQRVLVYLPGSGGEYITVCYNNQDLDKDYSFSKRAPGRNRYSCHNGFPGHNILFEESCKMPKKIGEWTDECRLNFNSEQELKNYLDEKDPEGDWRQKTGDPDSDKVVRKFPVGEFGTKEEVLVDNPVWFPTHYDYGLFREPVYKWLDFNDSYWLTHWFLSLTFKCDTSITPDKMNSLFLEFNVKNPDKSWHIDRWIYRNYYNQKFPESRISVDDANFRKEVDYIGWAEKNLEAIEKWLVEGNAMPSISNKCWDYLHNAMPK